MWGEPPKGTTERPLNREEAQVPLVSHQECRRVWGVTQGQLCAGEINGQKVCKSDSGGQLACQRKDKTWALLGITSFSKGCVQGATYTVFTDVRPYLQWIEAAAKQG